MGGASPNLLGAAAAASIILSKATGPTYGKGNVIVYRVIHKSTISCLSGSVDVAGLEGLEQEEIELTVLRGGLVHRLKEESNRV